EQAHPDPELSKSQSDRQESTKDNASLHRTIPATPTISFTAGAGKNDRQTRALYVPPPWERDQGHPILEIENRASDLVQDRHVNIIPTGSSQRVKEKPSSTTVPLELVMSRMFAIGAGPNRDQSVQSEEPQKISLSKDLDMPSLSAQATVGRNSLFHNLTAEDRELLGGIEYRSLRLLLKIVTVYFFGIHIFGAICLVGWIQHADPKYRQYLEECGQGSVWWGFYSAQTMVDNLGFTLTPDSMITFRDATFPMVLMSFLAYAGNTCYPCILRLVIWVMYKLCPRRLSLKEPLDFLLKHPRRCYTLLFPSRPTWVLFGILFAMNFIDIILILVLDLHNPAVNSLPPGPRILAAVFQAASSRHTGTSTFNLADVNPAVQFSLVVMMYIAVFPIAISVRASNTYEESALGLYPFEAGIDEKNGRSYIMTHIRNQLTFDLWYIFLGIFCICIAEADKITNTSDPAFSVFSVLFEVVSA
ncbi:cation transport protein-domain-containing protein, partial [Aspergillus leporis]